MESSISDEDRKRRIAYISAEERKWLEERLARAEPYDDDAPELSRFDGDESDIDRINATIAKKMLNGDIPVGKRSENS